MNDCVAATSRKILQEFCENVSAHYNIPIEDLQKNIIANMKSIPAPSPKPAINTLLIDAQKEPPTIVNPVADIDNHDNNHTEKSPKPKKAPIEVPDEIRCCATMKNKKRCNKPRKVGKFCKIHCEKDAKDTAQSQENASD